jgi:hypothetical protein
VEKQAKAIHNARIASSVREFGTQAACGITRIAPSLADRRPRDPPGIERKERIQRRDCRDRARPPSAVWNVKGKDGIAARKVDSVKARV